MIELRCGAAGLHLRDRFLDRASIECVPVDFRQAREARRAFSQFGKGRHLAGPNCGDCFAYAPARAIIQAYQWPHRRPNCMYGIELMIGGASVAVVVVAVMIHYEASALLTGITDRRSKRAQRPRMLVLIFGLLAAHLVEIFVFALGAWAMISLSGAGNLHWVGATEQASSTFFDFLYLSLVTYTTLGYGDLVPSGPVSFLYGLESLTGFVLITWSASLTFIEMQKHWKPSRP